MSSWPPSRWTEPVGGRENILHCSAAEHIDRVVEAILSVL